MAGTIDVSCPKCKKALRLPEELKGKKIRCKECGTIFPVGASAAAKPAGAAPKPKPAAAAPAKAKAAAAAKPQEPEESAGYGFLEDDGQAKAEEKTKPAAPPPVQPKPKGPVDESNPYGVTDTELTARCPHCAKEMESEDAIICLHCGYNTRTRMKAEMKVTYDTTGGDRFWWLLPGIINVLLIFFVIWLGYFFWFGLEETWQGVDDFTDTPTLSKGVRVWFEFGCAFAIYKCTRFAISRLILNPTPPEVEKK
jgi:hypothetical protein